MFRRLFAILIATLAVVLVVSDAAEAQQKTRDQKVREDRERVTSDGFWIYNDLDAAYAKAKESGKPIVVVLRCIPCEECVKLDDELVDQDPELAGLLEKFVCVRVISTNGLDLSLFQFDTDQSFAVFFLNADKTIYGRFGTRSHRTEWVGDVSLKGLAEALRGALELHAGYPGNRTSLAGKTGPQPLFDRPELFPSLKDKFTASLNYEGEVAKSCIHCHQIGDAARDFYRDKEQPIPAEILNPYPHPKSLGLVFDPTQTAVVKEVASGSLAEAAGFRKGDQIRTLGGQPLLSVADVQWVLHRQTPNGGQLVAEVQRGNQNSLVTLDLPAGWRELDDTSWRVSSWGMRRMVLGGMVLKPVGSEERGKNGVPKAGMALRVNSVGQYGPHATAKKAGFEKDDVIVSFDGIDSFDSEAGILRYGTTMRKAGENVLVVVLRGGQRQNLVLPMQK